MIPFPDSPNFYVFFNLKYSLSYINNNMSNNADTPNIVKYNCIDSLLNKRIIFDKLKAV